MMTTIPQTRQSGIKRFFERIHPYALKSSIWLFVLLFPFAFFHHQITTDDAWLGQQVHSLLQKGYITNNIFRDFPPLDGQIVVYHRLLIWCGAVVVRLLGWGVHQLWLVSVLAGIVTALMVYFARITDSTKATRLLAVSLLLFTPLLWRQMLIFRPEALVTACGFASFVVLNRAIKKDSTALLLLSGAFAGLAGLAHGLGMMFAIAGVTVLISERKYKPAILFFTVASLVFAPYVFGYFTERELFLAQLTQNQTMAARVSIRWWEPFVNLLNEHKRLFRKPEVIGISTLFALTLITHGNVLWRQHRSICIYLAALMVTLGAAPFPKMTHLMLPLIPFFALGIAYATTTPILARALRLNVRKMLPLVLGVVYIYGIGALVQAAFSPSAHQVETNSLLAAKLQHGTVVMAPFDFIFNEDGNFIIQSWRGAERFVANSPSSRALLQYAAQNGIRYLIADQELSHKWHLDEINKDSLDAPLQLILSFPDRDRYLYECRRRSVEVR